MPAPVRRSLRIRLLWLAAACAAAVTMAHAIAQGVGAIDFWAACFERGFGSGICGDLQYETPMPWWAATALPWVLESMIAAVTWILAIRAGHAVWLTGIALLLVVLSNAVIDYIMAPLINGGYSSADAAPGTGYFGAGALLVAAVLFFAAIPVALSARRAPALTRPGTA